MSPRSRVLACWVGLLLSVSSVAHAQQAEPLARYVPLDGLTILVENNGISSNPKAWKGTSTYKMLNETTLGVMLEDITAQLIDRALESGPPGAPVNGKETVGLLKHLLGEGFAVGFCGSLNPPQPQAVVIVIRNAGKNPVFKKVIAAIPPLNEPAAQKVDAPGGRTVYQIAGTPVRFWYEKEDAVFSFAPPGAPDPVLNVLEGKAASALKSPIREALTKGEPGEVSIGQIFVDMKALPPLPPKASELGLDAITRIEARLGILDKGLVTSIGVQAPRPRKGLLALVDQPAIGEAARLVLPQGTTDSSLASIDLVKTGDAIMALLTQNDPESAVKAAQFSALFTRRTGLSLRDDLAAKIGPRMAIVSPGGGVGFGNIYGMWFVPPEGAIVAELKEPKGFASTLDKLMEVVNRELKTAGALVPATPGQPGKPGTSFAEFRKLPDPERGYVLAVPPAVLPTPAGLRPTVIVDSSRGLIAFGTSPTAARKSLGTLVLRDSGAGKPRNPNVVAEAQTDTGTATQSLLISLPSLIQIGGYAAAQPGPGRPVNAKPLRLELDPDVIPTIDSFKPFLFPSRYSMMVDATSIRFTSYQAFPIQVPQLSSGMEAPVLIALLLPAVQAAREAARRTQCVNNMKQMGLAMHNYNTVNDGFPAQAIVDKQGKPLLSWRVAILPFLEQQELYNKFKLDEPWDSPNNKPLIAQMPKVYVCPSNPAGGEGMTHYQVFAGEGALLKPGKLTGLADVTDGTSNTLMVVEAEDGVIWTKPEDLPIPAVNQGLGGAGSRHPGGFNALFADGSVRFLKLTINHVVFQSLITRAGGEVINADAF